MSDRLEPVTQAAGAVILAGGRSRRMGESKAWLKVEQETILARLARIISQSCQPVVVVGRCGIELPPLPKHVVVTHDQDIWSGGGPLIGLYFGLTALLELSPKVDLVYLSGCDNLWLSTIHIQQMLSLLSDDLPCTFNLTWPRDSTGRGHPLCSAFRVASTHRRIKHLLDAGERRLSQLFESKLTLDVEYSSLLEPRVILPCNTPEQWAQIQPEG